MANQFPVVVVVDPTQAVAGAAVVEKSLTRLETQSSRLAKLFKRMFAGAVLAHAIGQTVKVLSDFDQQMATLKAVLMSTGDVSDKQLLRMRDAALEMGLTTRYSATQAADGLTILAKAGFSANESMESLPGTLQLAQAGALNLGESADIMTSVLRGFKMETREAGRVVDVLTKSANASNADVRDFAQSLKFVAISAKGTNQSIEETVAVLAAMSNAGIKSSMAGTGLRRVIGALEGPNATQIKMLKALGLSTDDVKVSTVGLATAIERIGKKTNDVGKFLNLFGQRGGPAGKIMDEYADKIKEYTKLNEEANGAGEKMANFMNDSLAGAIDRARVSFTALLIKIGDVGATNLLRQSFEGIADVIRFLARNADSFTAALGVMTVGLLAAYGASTKMRAGLEALRLVMAKNPATVWIVAITTLISLLVLFRDKLTIGSSGLATFRDFAIVVGQRLESFFNAIREGWTGVASSVKISIPGILSGVLTFILATFDSVLKVFDGFVGLFRGLHRSWEVLGTMMEQTWRHEWVKISSVVITNFGKAMNWVIDKWNDVAGKLGGKLIEPLNYESLIPKDTPEKFVKTGADIGKAFVEGWEFQAQNGLSAGLNKIIDDANNLVIQRTKDKIADLTPPTKTPVEPPEPPHDTNIPVEGKGKKDKGKSFWEWLARKREEIAMLKLSSREYEIQNGILELRDSLDRKLHPWEVAMADAALRTLQIARDQAQAYDDIKNPMMEVEVRQAALNALYEQGRITALEYSKAMDAVNIQGLMLTNTLQSGLSAGLLQVKQDIMNVSQVAASVMTNAFSGLENTLTEFTTNSKLNFSGFVDSVLQDVTRLMLRMAMLKAFGSIWGSAAVPGSVPTGSPSAMGLPMIESARGNDFTVGGSGGTDSKTALMSFTPGERVTVQTPKQQKENESAAPVVNVRVVNVTDPNEITEAMQSKKGEQVIVNVISRNRNAVRSTLG